MRSPGGCMCHRQIGPRTRAGATRVVIRGQAFTLVELLVVVAILALLLSIAMPTLARARSLAAAANCLAKTTQ